MVLKVAMNLLAVQGIDVAVNDGETAADGPVVRGKVGGGGGEERGGGEGEAIVEL
jgi:hypothetical protein